ncbi:MAG TPA: F0F1 ATP synthase subunit C [Candidatus Sulfomarinibacteraceae bacterium]|nr:F0F1 ATP synthase subunit C [Candidatus Sulfomarinibacteraceae bacterium]
MEDTTLIGMVSIIVAGFTISIGSIGPAIAQGRAVTEALRSLARQPDEADNITRTLFVGLALIESFAIYCLLISMVLIFFNPFWNELLGG